MLPALRKSLGEKIEVAVEFAALFISVSGTALALLFGRVVLSLLFGAVVLSLCFRVAGRSRTKAVAQARTPVWAYVLVSALSIVEVGVLVEAADLPVRFHQPGFSLTHWLIVVVCFVCVFSVQLWALRKLLAGQGRAGRES